MTSVAVECHRQPAPLPPNSVWPLTARAEELAFIAEALHANGKPGGVVLAGAAGVGKTRLAREALALACRRGTTPRWIAATASARVLPLGAFASLVSEFTGVDAANPVMLRKTADALLAAEAGSLAIGVDDAHLLDDFSATVLHQLALRRAVPLVVTVRSGEPAPDAITALWKDGHLRRLDVRPLSPEDTTALVESVLGGPLEGHSAGRLHAATQGNVLYVRHIVDGALNAGALRQVAGVWQWRGDGQLSPRLNDLVDAQIGALSAELRDVLEVLAFGEPLQERLLARLVETHALEEADRRGLITVEPRGRQLEVRLAHPIYGEVVRRKTGMLRARRWRGRIARALHASEPERPEDLLRHAVLTLESDSPPDAERLASAARVAASLLDMRLAERLARTASELGGGFEPQLTLCYALVWQGKFAEADAALAELEVAAETDEQRTRSAIARAQNLFWGLGRTGKANAAVDRVEAVVADQGCLDELSGFRSAMAYAEGRCTDAAALATTVPSGSGARAGAVFWAAMGATGSLGLLGRADEIGDIPARGMAAAMGSFERSWLRFSLGAKEIASACLAGRLADADERAKKLAIDGRRQGPIAGALCSVLTGSVDLEAGMVGSAARSLREAAAGLAVHDTCGEWSVQCGLSLAQTLACLGDVDGARAALAFAEDAADPATACQRPQLTLGRAWLAAAEGALSEAISIAREAAADAAAGGQHAVEAVALHTAVRFGDRTAADRLTELCSIVDGERVRVSAAHGAALAADDGRALDLASAQWEAIGAVLIAADAAAHAAAAYHRHSERSLGLKATARAQRLMTACEGAQTPAIRTVAQPLPLTSREREIADLVVAGLSYKEVAERLTISVRTVEGHVYHACTKLDVPDRASLIALLQGTAG